MASVKVKFRASSVADREGRLYYQIMHNLSLIHIYFELNELMHEKENIIRMKTAEGVEPRKVRYL